MLARRAIAWSGASIRQRLTGHIDPADAADLEERVRVESVTGELDAA